MGSARRRNASLAHLIEALTADMEPRWKQFTRRTCGRGGRHDDLNVRINHFNRLLRADYACREPAFDLARVESTGTDGRRVFFERGDQTSHRSGPAVVATSTRLDVVASLGGSSPLSIAPVPQVTLFARTRSVVSAPRSVSRERRQNATACVQQWANSLSHQPIGIARLGYRRCSTACVRSDRSPATERRP